MTPGAGDGASQEAQRRTGQLIPESVLPAIPAARLINGIRILDPIHPTVHHLLVAGDRIAIVDGYLLPQDKYTWDQSTVSHDGKKVAAPTLAFAVAALRRQFPTMKVEGWVVIHSPAGGLRKPAVAVVPGPPPSGAPGAGLVNAEGLCWALHGFLAGGTKAEVVDAPVLAKLLDRMY